MKKILTGLGLALAGTCAMAQPPAPVPAPAASSAAAPAVSKQMHDDIMQMLQMTLSPRLGEITKAMSTIYVMNLQAKYRDVSPAVADEIRADIAKIVGDPERVKVLEESLVPVYAQVYTDDDIRQILAFGKTPAGLKMFSGSPTAEQINAALQPWAVGTVAPAIMMDTAHILKQHNITVDADSQGNGPSH
jgi:hypothetical protein